MKNAKTAVALLISCTVVGCSNVYHHPDAGVLDVKSTPPLHLLELSALSAAKDSSADGANNQDTLTLALNEQVKLGYALNDRTVYTFAYLVEDTMKKRVDHGRVWEEGLSALQVILAALASAFSATTGVSPDVVTTLAGLSALTPEITDIINAGAKAKAYSQGLELVEAANSTYISARSVAVAGDTKALIPSDSLSPEGAALFVSVMSTLKVMRNALLQTLPKEEDLAKASGKYQLFAVDTNHIPIEVEQAFKARFLQDVDATPFAFSDEGQSYYTRSISVVRGGKLAKCTSSAPNIVQVSSCSEQSLSIIPLQQGSAEITVINEAGLRTTVRVDIGDKLPQPETTKSVEPQ